MTKTATVQAQQRWEYAELTRKTQGYLITEMTDLGLNGWELVSVTKHKESRPGQGEAWFWTAFLKRPHAGHVTANSDSEKGVVASAPPISKPATLKPSDGEDMGFEFAESPSEEQLAEEAAAVPPKED